MSEHYIDAPPPPEQRITELHVWIAIYPDGSEGIVSADLPLSFGTRHSPLLSSKRKVAESLGRLAREVQRAAMHQAQRIVRVELRTYRLTEPA